MIDINSLVQCNYDFERERNAFDHDYPHKGDLLTVKKKATDMEGETVLWFHELKITVPLYENCFDELQDEADGDMILNETFKIANNIS